ncbi:hypothetical protein HK100_010398 [Physocladia obscura]|uniref:Transmembrane protein n=1 Tax=Physocladia obscura TaxID=109957 RepID=A0AAD5T3P3_9FUNG|nr:hypothetical protein HK100_010398 [Physocladia obscura]
MGTHNGVCEAWLIYKNLKLRDSLLIVVVSNVDPDQAESYSDVWFNFKVQLTYNAVFLASTAFWFYLTYDAIMNVNIIQIISINFYNVGLFVYSITQIFQLIKDRAVVENELTGAASVNSNNISFLAVQILIPIIIGIFIPLFIFLTCRLNQDFNWRQYRITGGDIKMRKMFFRYDTFLLLIKFSLFFVSGFTVIDLVLTEVSNNGVIVIPIIGAFFGVGIPLAGYYSARYESKQLFICFELGIVLVFAYMIERIYDAYERSGGETVQRVEIPFIMYSAASMILLIANFVFGILCFKNYDKGLKSTLDSERSRKKAALKNQMRGIESEIQDHNQNLDD